MLLNCGVGEDSWESLGLQGDPTSPSERKSVLNIHWKDWCWKWNSTTLATWCEKLTHWKRPWWWERLKARREGDGRGWDGWTASPTQWTRVWVNSRNGDGQGGMACCSPFLPVNIQDWFPFWLTDLISKQSKGLSRVSSNTTVWKHQFFSTQPS